MAKSLGVVTVSSLFGAMLLSASCGSSREGFTTEPPPTTGFSDGGLTEGGLGLPDEQTRDPVTCAEAAQSKSYVGCDYWPTITPNLVWSIFDYAVVVANTGATDANVTVTGPLGTNKQASVPPGQLRTIYLPWVPALKGPDADSCGSGAVGMDSIQAPQGAFHLVSDVPVIVYQFNALQYEGKGAGGPDGADKDWSTCPGNTCAIPNPCFSYSNDASLLLPTTAMTNSYRVGGNRGPSAAPPGFPFTLPAATLTITATDANTQVTLTLSTLTGVKASTTGPAIPATASGTMTLTLPNAGDVVTLVAEQGKDFSGSLVQSDKHVQVVSGIPCVTLPEDSSACDHIEETVLPAETLGKHYVVANPTGPKGSGVGQIVRFFGNKDGTRLTYTPSKPAGCPVVLNAGEMVDCGEVRFGFEVTGDQEFGIGTFLEGATVYQDTKGDPSMSNAVAVEQYRTKYVFLAPADYPVQHADITGTADAEITVDGAPVPASSFEAMATDSPFGVYRVDLTSSGQNGAHTLTSKRPVGVQVIGFGDYTSFQYPAGMNLKLIAAPPK